MRYPVCAIPVSPLLPEALIDGYLSALAEAYALLVHGLGLPAPLSDAGAGGTSALDAYLFAADAAEPFEVRRDPALSPSDRTSAHCVLAAAWSRERLHAAWCVAEAILLGLDAAEGDGVRRALAAHLASLVGGSSTALGAAIDDVQANPQLGLLTRDLHEDSAGASIFFQALDARLGASGPGVLPASLFALARARSPRGAPEWSDEPDLVDVLRQTLGGEEALSDFVLSQAVTRAFLGSRDDGSGLPSLLWLGDLGRVRFDWVLEASSLPRRVAPLRPLEPLGASYSWLVLDRVSIDKALAFRAEWEAPVAMRWSLVAVDAQGRALKRYDLPYVEGATRAERTLEDHHGAAALLIVGTSLGGAGPAHPFDPALEPWQPHGFTIYLAEL